MFAVLALVLAAPPTIDIPAEIRPAGQYLAFSPKTDGVAVEYIGFDGIDPFPSKFLKDPRDFILDTRGLAAKRYRFVAVVSSNTGELTRAQFAVVVGDPGPDPGPGPGPGPGPEPNDPFWPTLKAAFAAEASTTKRDEAKRLASVMRLASQEANGSHATLGDLNARVKQISEANVPPGQLSGVKTAINKELQKVGTDPATVMTPEMKRACYQMFDRLGKLLEAL